MGSDTAKYTARKYHNYIETKEPYIRPEEVVLAILKDKGDDQKREDIIREFKNREGCKDLDIDEVVNGALSKLLKDGKIEKMEYGIYSAK